MHPLVLEVLGVLQALGVLLHHLVLGVLHYQQVLGVLEVLVDRMCYYPPDPRYLVGLEVLGVLVEVAHQQVLVVQLVLVGLEVLGVL